MIVGRIAVNIAVRREAKPDEQAGTMNPPV
jgi:hypothetical protein